MPASPDDGARYAAQVADLVATAETVLLRRIARALAAGITTPGWEHEALARLQLLQRRMGADVTDLEKAVAATIRRVLLEAHNAGAALALTDLERLGLVLPGVPPIASTLRTAEQLADRTAHAIRSVPTLLTRVYRQAVQAGAGEVLAGSNTRLEAAQHVLDRLVSNGVTGFRDVSGRQWGLTSYVEMAVRTEAGQTAVAGHTDALASAGVDLVKVSDSPRECPLCRPWEGKVLSLSGRVGAVLEPSLTGGGAVRVHIAGSLAEAKAAGLQHPNCAHNLTAVLPGATVLKPAVHDAAGYEAKQRQRALERKVREWKRREALALDDAAAARARAKVRAWQAALREHVAANDLKRLSRREQIDVAT